MLDFHQAVLILAAVLLFPVPPANADQAQEFDVVVYGGTSGGVAAAVQVARMGKSVALVEATEHLGGLTSGGLGATDIGNKAAIGGISREFYRRIKEHYAKDAAWTWQLRGDYRSSRHQSEHEDTMWTFEPHVAEMIMFEFAGHDNIELFLGERLDLSREVELEGTWIKGITLESGLKLIGQRFIDATYEGDLMAKAGVSYIVGREPNATYGETLNGVQTENAKHHQFESNVDPYLVRGDPSSGLVPGIHEGGSGAEGSGDYRVQAYCLRMCNTQHPPNRLPFAKPDGYDERDYELLFRNFEASADIALWHPLAMPNHKTDTNNNGGFSTDYIGKSYDWADADYAQRAKIHQEHVRYQAGLLWTLANHPRVPETVRQEFSRWGNCRDEFQETGGWSHQLYVREARRMIGATVMTEHHCQGREVAHDAIGLAAYTMDSHNVQRYVDENGHVRNEGDVQVGGFPPYPISFGAVTPKPEECTNLLIPVCLSASHIAYGSIRMEPVFMVLGQSAATAACLSVDQAVAVQEVDFESLQARLLADKQVLEWK